jgi:hypothetical protein
MEKAWESIGLRFAFKSKKEQVRAFILSAELFTPNVLKHGVETSMSAPITADQERMKRVIDFILNKRTKYDVVLLFDGRSKSCRRVMEQAEDKLAASGAHSVLEYWFVYLMPTKTQDPRIPARQINYSVSNREVGILFGAREQFA